MTYTPNIPLITNKIRTSQFDINQNFNQLDSLFGLNHVKYSDQTGDAGKHLFQTLINLTDEAIAVPGTSASEMAVYAKDDGSGTPGLYYREPSSGTEVLFSGPIISGSNPGDAGEVNLIGGAILKWGTFTHSGTGVTTKTYASFGLSNYATATFIVLGMAVDQGVELFHFGSLTPAQFAYQQTAGTQKTQWLAIGI